MLIVDVKYSTEKFFRNLQNCKKVVCFSVISILYYVNNLELLYFFVLQSKLLH